MGPLTPRREPRYLRHRPPPFRQRPQHTCATDGRVVPAPETFPGRRFLARRKGATRGRGRSGRDALALRRAPTCARDLGPGRPFGLRPRLARVEPGGLWRARAGSRRSEDRGFGGRTSPRAGVAVVGEGGGDQGPRTLAPRKARAHWPR